MAGPSTNRELLGLRFRKALARAQDGRSAVVIVHGEAGIGESRLIERFLNTAGVAKVLRAGAAEQEAGIDYGVADQLLRDPGEWRSGLLTAPNVLDDLTVGRRLVERLAAQEVVVIDDAQWLDEASTRVLVFALRRTWGNGLLAIVVAREDEGKPVPDALVKLAGEGVVRVGPMSEEEIRAVAQEAGEPISAFAARRLADHTGGNPAFVLSLLRELAPGAWEDPTRELGVPRRVATRVARELAALSEETADVVRAASV